MRPNRLMQGRFTRRQRSRRPRLVHPPRPWSRPILRLVPPNQARWPIRLRPGPPPRPLAPLQSRRGRAHRRLHRRVGLGPKQNRPGRPARKGALTCRSAATVRVPKCPRCRMARTQSPTSSRPLPKLITSVRLRPRLVNMFRPRLAKALGIARQPTSHCPRRLRRNLARSVHELKRIRRFRCPRRSRRCRCRCNLPAAACRPAHRRLTRG